jgi:hypothetical protein
VIGIAVALAYGIFFAIKGITSAQTRIEENSRVKKFRKAFGTKGIAHSPIPTWKTFMDEQLEIAKKLGLKYTVKLKVHLKSATSKNNTVEGFAVNYDEEGPFDIYIWPVHSVSWSRDDFINFLVRYLEDDPTFTKTCKEDQDYAARITKIFTDKPTENIKHQLKQASESDFVRITEELDLSRYTNLLFEHSRSASISSEDRRISFVRGEDIVAVEVLGYGTPFSVKIKDMNGLAIPRSYNYGETMARKMTIQ